MSNVSNRNTRKSSSSGPRALVMGGQPSDDPRDMNSGGWDPNDDRSNPVDGPGGNEHSDLSGGNVSGVKRDKVVSTQIDEALEKAR